MYGELIFPTKGGRAVDLGPGVTLTKNAVILMLLLATPLSSLLSVSLSLFFLSEITPLSFIYPFIS